MNIIIITKHFLNLNKTEVVEIKHANFFKKKLTDMLKNRSLIGNNSETF